LKLVFNVLQYLLFYCFILAARSTRRKETHARLHAKKTKSNARETSSLLEAITHAPTHTRRSYWRRR